MKIDLEEHYTGYYENTPATLRSHVGGTRWHGLKSLLYEVAIQAGCKLTILDEDRGWIFHTVFFRMDGTVSRLRHAAKLMRQVKRQYEG